MKRRLHAGPWLAAALLAAGSGAQAQIFECTDDAGRTTYTDRPCATGETATVVEPPPAATPAPPPRATPRPSNDRSAVQRGLDVHENARRSAAVREAFDAQMAARPRPPTRRERQAARCEANRKLLADLTHSECFGEICEFSALVLTDDDGTERYATEHEKKAEIERLREVIADEC